jgi:hypothetical protein
MAVVGVVIGLIVLALVWLPLSLRRRRLANGLRSLGPVSSQWLITHRNEDL